VVAVRIPILQQLAAESWQERIFATVDIAGPERHAVQPVQGRCIGRGQTRILLCNQMTGSVMLQSTDEHSYLFPGHRAQVLDLPDGFAARADYRQRRCEMVHAGVHDLIRFAGLQAPVFSRV